LYGSGQAEAFARRVRTVADEALALFSPSYEETLERWSRWQEAAREERGWSDGEEDFFKGYANLVFALGGYHPERTSCGTRVPYLKKDGLTFGFLNLNPEMLPPSCPAGEYWPRMGTSIMPRWVGEMVSAADAPVNDREDRQFPEADNLERTLDQADKLLNAAQADKRRVIPPARSFNWLSAPFALLNSTKWTMRLALWPEPTAGRFLWATCEIRGPGGTYGGRVRCSSI
jgi:hypothetical protein